MRQEKEEEIKVCDLYKLLYSLRNGIPRLDRYTVWQKIENSTLDILEDILKASQTPIPSPFCILFGSNPQFS